MIKQTFEIMSTADFFVVEAAAEVAPVQLELKTVLAVVAAQPTAVLLLLAYPNSALFAHAAFLEGHTQVALH